MESPERKRQAQEAAPPDTPEDNPAAVPIPVESSVARIQVEAPAVSGSPIHNSPAERTDCSAVAFAVASGTARSGHMDLRCAALAAGSETDSAYATAAALAAPAFVAIDSLAATAVLAFAASDASEALASAAIGASVVTETAAIGASSGAIPETEPVPTVAQEVPVQVELWLCILACVASLALGGIGAYVAIGRWSSRSLQRAQADAAQLLASTRAQAEANAKTIETQDAVMQSIMNI